MLEILTTKAEGSVPVTIMHLHGDLDTVGADVFDSSAQEVIAGGAEDVLVDLSGVTFISSAGIRSLHRLFYKLHPEDSAEYKRILNEGIRQGVYKASHMKLRAPVSHVTDPLKIMGVDLYMEILNTSEKEAVSTF